MTKKLPPEQKTQVRNYPCPKCKRGMYIVDCRWKKSTNVLRRNRECPIHGIFITVEVLANETGDGPKEKKVARRALEKAQAALGSALKEVL